MIEYEVEFQKCEAACGEPFNEFVEFFERSPHELSVLDLGCGQGRDALMAARQGHNVMGVDLAPTGVAQMLAGAAREGLAVTGGWRTSNWTRRATIMTLSFSTEFSTCLRGRTTGQRCSTR